MQFDRIGGLAYFFIGRSNGFCVSGQMKDSTWAPTTMSSSSIPSSPHAIASDGWLTFQICKTTLSNRKKGQTTTTTKSNTATRYTLAKLFVLGIAREIAIGVLHILQLGQDFFKVFRLWELMKAVQLNANTRR